MEFQGDRKQSLAMSLDDKPELLYKEPLKGHAQCLLGRKANISTKVIADYLLHEAPEFRRLSELRRKVKPIEF